VHQGPAAERAFAGLDAHEADHVPGARVIRDGGGTLARVFRLDVVDTRNLAGGRRIRAVTFDLVFVDREPEYDGHGDRKEQHKPRANPETCRPLQQKFHGVLPMAESTRRPAPYRAKAAA
jgi:hypothetical protein